MPMSGFICHDDYLAKTSKLTDAELGRLFRSLMKYHATGAADEIDGRESLAFDFIKADIDKAENAYKAKCEKNRNNRLSAIDNVRQQSLTIVNERIQSKQQDGGEESKRKRFVPPTVEEVSAYCRERNNKVDAQQFVDFYASKGWKVGNQAMKDWKAAVGTWERRDKQQPEKPAKVVIAQQYKQRDISGADQEVLERMKRMVMEGGA